MSGIPDDIRTTAYNLGVDIRHHIAHSKRDLFEHDATIDEMIAEVIVVDRQRDQWQDISTAPKDGRWIMVCSPDHALPEFAYWDGDEWATGNCGLSPVFTHWCPLPAAPEAGG